MMASSASGTSIPSSRILGAQITLSTPVLNCRNLESRSSLLESLSSGNDEALLLITNASRRALSFDSEKTKVPLRLSRSGAICSTRESLLVALASRRFRSAAPLPMVKDFCLWSFGIDVQLKYSRLHSPLVEGSDNLKGIFCRSTEIAKTSDHERITLSKWFQALI